MAGYIEKDSDIDKEDIDIICNLTNNHGLFKPLTDQFIRITIGQIEMCILAFGVGVTSKIMVLELMLHMMKT